MKYLLKNFCLIFLLLTNILFINNKSFAVDKKIIYTKDNISNYLSGIISANQDYTSAAFKYLSKAETIRSAHSHFNEQYIRTLVLLEKFDKAFLFSKDLLKEGNSVFEANLLLGIDSFVKGNYSDAEKYFSNLDRISGYNIFFEDLIGDILIVWVKAAQKNKNASFEFLDKFPDRYENLKKIQKSFLNCYFNTPQTENVFRKLIQDKEINFSRYSFFLSNYLIYKNKNHEAKQLIFDTGKLYNENLLIKQTEDFILKKEVKKIKKLFNCENPKDVIAEIFYILANLYATENDYQLSNFYLKISFFLNKKFTPNKTLLAENLYYLKQYELSKKVYKSLQQIGYIYSWYSAKSVAAITSRIKDKKSSITVLEKEFESFSNPSVKHYYELANFYKDNGYFKKSIEYYSLALKKIKKDHYLFPKILDRRGTSYERIGKWEQAEKDLMESLKISPNSPHVLNYLAYSWVEKKINIQKALQMLEQATELKKNDGYIIDSLGWAHYMNKNYISAEKFLQRAVELKPLDPIINDHYADTLWMLQKNIQARYVWKQVLNLEETEEKLKKEIKNKLIFGVTSKL